jgi:DNA polymerase I-like protein with 3'-5' exonuclease and polymerase domains
VDVHGLIAEYVWGAPPDETTGKRRRYQAKRIVFGRLYGGGIDTLAAQAGLGDRHDLVTRALDAMDEITPGVTAWSNQVKTMIRGGQTQYQTYSGRVIHLDKRYPHKAPNYLIQGTARELLVDSLLRWDASEHGGGVILPIHDEIVAVVPEATADAALDTLLACMTSELGGVPVVAESGGAPAERWRSAA